MRFRGDVVRLSWKIPSPIHIERPRKHDLVEDSQLVNYNDLTVTSLETLIVGMGNYPKMRLFPLFQISERVQFTQTYVLDEG